MKILLVDDSEPFRQTIAQLLRAHGHEVIEAPNGLDGVKLARVHLPDVIVSDISMPDMDGLQLVEAIRSRSPGTPVVLMTGRGSEEVAIVTWNPSSISPSISEVAMTASPRKVLRMTSTFPPGLSLRLAGHTENRLQNAVLFKVCYFSALTWR